MPEAPYAGSQDDLIAAHVQAVIAECLRRRSVGEIVADESLIAQYPELMPRLGEELRKLRLIAAARTRAEDSTPSLQSDVTEFGLDSANHHASSSGGGSLEIRCPTCHVPMVVAVDTPLTDLTCGSCGTHFSLVDQSTKTWTAQAFSTVGRFELVERIGVGGFGTVWKARDRQLGRTVAIKIPRQGVATVTEQEKFFREARAAAQLCHANIVTVHEVGRDGDSVYIVSDFVHGVNLDDWLSGQQLTGRESAELCATIAEALHHAHEKGVIHRDLKPANIMIDADGEPRIMDFGLARRDVGEITVTVEGHPLGTPAYMSPEQAEGRAHTADRRSDVYSLGAILFQLLTGELPFRGSPLMLVHQVVNDLPPSPRKFNTRVPRDLETITLKCLEKDPARRYADARALADELHRFLRGEPIHARPIGRAARAWRWCQRNPVPAWASAIAAAALLAVVMVSVSFAIYQGRAANHLRQEKENTAAALAETVEQRRLADSRLAEAYLDRGLVLSSQGDVGQGLLWMARSLELAGSADGALRQSIRANVSSWMAELHPLQHILDHQGLVYGVAFSPDGKLLLTGGKDRSARLWDIESGRLYARMPHHDAVLCVAFHPNGKSVATGTANGEVTIWNVVQGAPDGTPLIHPKEVQSLAFSPDGSTLVTGCGDGMARRWNVATRMLVGTPLDHTAAIHAVAFSPRGDVIATGGRDIRWRMWDAASGGKIGEPLGHDIDDLGAIDAVRCLAFNPQGTRVLTGSGYSAQLWDAKTGSQITFKFPHQSFVKGVAFGPDGTMFATACVDNKVRLWDGTSNKLIGAPLFHRYPVWAVSVSPDGRTIASGSGDEFGEEGEVRIWRMRPQAPNFALPHPSSVWAVAYSPDGQRIATASADAKARLWDNGPSSDEPIRELPLEGTAYAMAFSPDGSKLAAGGRDDVSHKGVAHLWDLATGNVVGASIEQPAPIWAMAFSPDGQTLLAGGQSGEAVMYRVGDLKPFGYRLPHPPQVNAITFSSDGRTVVTAGEYDMAARIWDARSGEARGPRLLHQNVVKSVASSPDGKLIATGCWNNYAQLWSSITGDAIGPQLRHDGPVWAVAFSPDGKTLATASVDQTAQLWEVATGRRLGRPIRHGAHVLDVTFRPDGKAILTGTFENENLAQEWPVPEPVTVSPDQLTVWLNQATGMELDEGGELRLLTESAWRKVHEQLAALDEPPTTRENPSNQGSNKTPAVKAAAPGPAPRANEESSEKRAEIAVNHDDLQWETNVQVRTGFYRVPDANENGVIHIKGDSIVIDGQGATLDGGSDGLLPDQFRGWGIVVEDSTNVVVRNFKVRGFKVAIYARNCRGVTIENCDVSDNWKMRLRGTPEAEDGADWLFPHNNDQNEWLRYGAGIYVDSSRNAIVRNNIGQRGQNGLCVVRSSLCKVYDNDFSFNSGWGVALYRSRLVEVAHNKCDWCIRGYSHGVYNRGQDSAGILVFEQCSNNIFAFNSATHSGDGFFLFAGNETLNTGEGGCNQNLVYGNDFSYASNNGIEATFSTRNCFANNIMDEADHAIWAGYSYDSVFVANRIKNCNHGVSIEHGNGNIIEGNEIDDCGVAINLWANANSDFARGPFGKTHSCRSEKYEIAKNRLKRNKQHFRISNSSDVAIRQNELSGPDAAFAIAGDSHGIIIDGNNIEGSWNGDSFRQIAFNRNYWKSPPDGAPDLVEKPLAIEFDKLQKRPPEPTAPGSLDTTLPRTMPRGREFILVDEWGPYDFRKPRLAPAELFASQDGRISLLGAGGEFVIEDVEGDVTVTPQKGTLPARLKVSLAQPKTATFSFVARLADSGERLRASGVLLAAAWDVNFYRWRSAGPQKPPADWKQVVAAAPLHHKSRPSIDFNWQSDGPNADVGADYFATVATTEIEIPAGKWEFQTLSDDGVRVFVDGAPVIDNWTWHGPTLDRAEKTLAAGKHSIRIEHFEIDGWAVLQFSVRPVK